MVEHENSMMESMRPKTHMNQLAHDEIWEALKHEEGPNLAFLANADTLTYY